MVGLFIYILFQYTFRCFLNFLTWFYTWKFLKESVLHTNAVLSKISATIKPFYRKEEE